MQKVFSLALWLVVSLEGAVLVAYSPRSWLCTNTSLDNVVWNPKNGKILVDYLAGQHAELWDIDGEQPERTYRFQIGNEDKTGVESSRLSSMAYAPDGKTILTGISDGRIVLWDAQTGTLLKAWQGHRGWVTSVAYSPDGRTVLTGGKDGTALIWDMQSGTSLHVLPLQGRLQDGLQIVISSAFAPDGETLLTGNSDGTATVWDTHSGMRLRILQAGTNVVASVAFAPDGKSVLTGSDDHAAIVWDARSGMILHKLQSGIALYTFQGGFPKLYAAFAADGKTALTSIEDGTATVWNVHSGEPVSSIKRDVMTIAYSPDGKTVLMRDDDYTSVLLWDVQSGVFVRPLCPLLLGKPWQWVGLALCLLSVIGFPLMVLRGLRRRGSAITR